MAHWTPGVTNVLIHHADSCTFQGLAHLRLDHFHTRSAAHHGQLCSQQATRTQAWTPSTVHPHQTLPQCPHTMVKRTIPKTSGITAAIPTAAHPQLPLDLLYTQPNLGHPLQSLQNKECDTPGLLSPHRAGPAPSSCPSPCSQHAALHSSPLIHPLRFTRLHQRHKPRPGKASSLI